MIIFYFIIEKKTITGEPRVDAVKKEHLVKLIFNTFSVRKVKIYHILFFLKRDNANTSEKHEKIY